MEDIQQQRQQTGHLHHTNQVAVSLCTLGTLALVMHSRHSRYALQALYLCSLSTLFMHSRHSRHSLYALQALYLCTPGTLNCWTTPPVFIVNFVISHGYCRPHSLSSSLFAQLSLMVAVGLILCRVHCLLSYLSWLLLASFSVVFTICLGSDQTITQSTLGERHQGRGTIMGNTAYQCYWYLGFQSANKHVTPQCSLQCWNLGEGFGAQSA